MIKLGAVVQFRMGLTGRDLTGTVTGKAMRPAPWLPRAYPVKVDGIEYEVEEGDIFSVDGKSCV